MSSQNIAVAHPVPVNIKIRSSESVMSVKSPEKN